MGNKNIDELKIVVVDDADLTRNTIVNILNDAGYNVVGEANSAEEAIKIMFSSGANLFLIDVVMPEISGIELAQLISEKSTKTSIIMMSSLGNENVVIDAISKGALDFLKKPFEAEELITSIEKIKMRMLDKD